jgi:hypothetical protein
MYQRSLFSTFRARIEQENRFIQVLLGPRQVGKTTGLQEVIRALGQKIPGAELLLHSADEPLLRDRDWIVSRWEEARARASGGRFVLLCFDEVQKVFQWSETVKALWDSDRRAGLNLRVVLLGSSTLLIQDGLTESLAGRFELSRVSHWLYPEMRDAFGFTWEDWVYFGGYPGAAPLKDSIERWSAYVRDSLIETTVSKDVLLVRRIDKPALLRRLFQLGAAFSGQMLSYQKMLGQLQDAGNTTTLAHYLELLDQAGLMTGLPKYSGLESRKRSSSPKLQVYNPALQSALSTKGPTDVRSDPELWGRKVESAVGAHLLNLSWGSLSTLSYWNRGDAEVDFILHSPDRLIAFEVKSGRQRGREHRGLTLFRAGFPNSINYVVGGPDGIPFEEFFSAPLSRW